MIEVVILPEMEQAGEEAIRESRTLGADDRSQAIAAYTAMRAVYLMSVLPGQTEAIH